MPDASVAIPPIFVSHSHEDNDFGKRLVEDLRAALGNEQLVWYDELGGTHGGDVIWNTIVTEITARPLFIIVVSPDSMRSNWVLAELATAWTLINSRDADPRRRIIPVVYRETELRADLRMLLWIPFYPPATYDASFQRLLAAVRQPPAAAGARHAAPSHQPVAAVPPPTLPADPQAALVRAKLPEMERDYAARNWIGVTDTAAYLARHAPNAITPAVSRLWGLALLAEGDLTGARPALDRALGLDADGTPSRLFGPEDVAVLLAAAQLRARASQPAAAEPLLADALITAASDPSAQVNVLREYVGVLAALGRWDDVLRRAGQGERLVPDDRAWPAARLDALSHLNRTADALDNARTLAERRDARPADWIALARLTQRASHNRTQVRAVLDAADQRFPADNSLAQARRELLPPMLPRERFPERLECLGFAAELATDPQTGKEVVYILPPLCRVAAGPFHMGSDKRQDPQADDRELPQHEVTLPAYAIAAFPVTVAEYALFVASGHPAPQKGAYGVDWQTQLTRLDHPVTCVTWRDATAYAAWLARLTGQPWKLPSEAEWEKAARWDPALRVSRLYPWGDQWDASRANTRESGTGGTTPMGSYPNGASPCGAQDLAGNVWEWTSSRFQPYPYTPSDGRENPHSTGNRVLRGGSWNSTARYARAAYRFLNGPDYFSVNDGFRVALAAAE